ncbi:MAG: YebC/PmpR family DNA-binding transcriptional regulator [Verrucomicrobiales bacterium]|nr:YebC/PmpR family DNA-binding transcriptional regulator [Verrucomicrobiales bacterium]
MGRAFEYRRKAKEQRWDKMSKVFPKLAKAITMAAKDGGPDPDLNPKLRLAIVNAKAENMPKDNIESAIKRASGKDAAEISEVNYEGKGPHGVMVFVECATDNTNRTVTNVKTAFNKNGGEVVDSGSLSYLFERKAVVEFAVADELDMDEIELGLIDHGLEELEVNGGIAYATGDYTEFGNLSKGAEDLGVEISKASLQRIPTSPVEFSEAQMEEIETLIDVLEDDEDVQAVFTNVA